MKPGRPKKLTFPIRRIEVVHGVSLERVVEENTAVNCVQCGLMFLINYDTACISRDEIGSDIQEVRCPFCGRRACIYHYYDQIEKKKKRQRQRQN